MQSVSINGMIHIMSLLIKNIKLSLIRSPRKLIIVVFILVGTIMLVATRAATPTASIEPEGGNKSGNYSISTGNGASGNSAIRFSAATAGTCGKRVPNYSYVVPFANAAWNQPICDMPLHPQSAEFASRFYNYANGLNVQPSSKGNMGVKLGFDDGTADGFGRNVYYASRSTITKQIYSNNGVSNLDGADLIQGDIKRTVPDRRIPWDNTWITNRGGDNEIVIIEDRENANIPSGLAPKGSIYELSGLRRSDDAGLLCGLFYLASYSNRLCTYTVRIVRDPNGEIINMYDYEGSANSRGGGISMFATLTTPEEIDAGEIRHALGIGIFNTSSGPECTIAQRGTSAENESCGTAFAPAGKFEWAKGTRCEPFPNDRYCGLEINMSIPEGMRFRLKNDPVTNNAINAWLDAKNYSAAKERTVRIFITAMQDYGFIPVDTGGVTQVQVAAGLNPEAKALWVKNGITTEDDKRMLHGGLITASNIEVVRPPTNNCVSGSPSKYWCEYFTSTYSN